MGWTAAARRADFGDRDVIGVDCGGERLALYRVGGDIRATSDACPHQGASLSAGCLVDSYIECPVHFALFDIRTGESDGAMTTKRVRVFATRVDDDVVYVDLPDVGEQER